MRIAVFWTGVSGPAAACWRALAALPGYKVRVFVEEHVGGASSLEHHKVLEGLNYDLRFATDPLDERRLAGCVNAFAPDVMLILGWRSRMCRAAAECPASRHVPKIFAFDMPFSWSLRKLLARPILWRYLRRFSAAFVPGESSARYAEWLGFPPSAIHRGLISVDTLTYGCACRTRLSLPESPRRFAFVGRYVPCKGIATLVDGYRRYRSMTGQPWELVCYGDGPEKKRLVNVEGIHDAGFAQPASIAKILSQASALVLPSIYDPWPMAVLEAIAAGLPVCCTTACGNHGELLDLGVNGFISAPGDAAGLAQSLLAAEAGAGSAVRVADAGLQKAGQYDASAWAARVEGICQVLTSCRPNIKES